MADVRALLPVTEFDPAPFSLEAHDQAVVQFVEEARAVALAVGTVLNGG